MSKDVAAVASAHPVERRLDQRLDRELELA
jgi:hypothetical protein